MLLRSAISCACRFVARCDRCNSFNMLSAIEGHDSLTKLGRVLHGATARTSSHKQRCLAGGSLDASALSIRKDCGGM